MRGGLELSVSKEVTTMENKAVLNGYVGGNMTRKMVAFAEQAIAQGQTAAINSAAQTEQIK